MKTPSLISRVVAPLSVGWTVRAMVVLASLGEVSCATAPPPMPRRAPECMAAPTAGTSASAPSLPARPVAPPAPTPSSRSTQELRVRHAVSSSAMTDELPGWHQACLRVERTLS